MHAHLSYTKASALPILLANGVTGVRDMGGFLGELDQWRTLVDSGLRAGPRIVRAGPIVNGKQFNEFQIAVNDAAEARGAVRALRHSGVDFIKVHAAIFREAYIGVCEECKRLNFSFAGHIPRAVTPEEVSDRGQVSVEHVSAIGDRLAKAGIAADKLADALADFRKQEAPALFARFARNGTYFTPFTPTGSLQSGHPYGRSQIRPAGSLRLYFLQKDYRGIADPARLSGVSPTRVSRPAGARVSGIARVELLNRSGVRLLAGTDFAASILYPGFSLHDDLALLVEAGLTPMQALQTATRNPAQMLRRNDLGTIAAGKLADLVLLDADPLADIRNTQKIRSVVSRGKLLDRRALDQLLVQGEAEAAHS